jgi:HlyD family secretion protein
MANKKIFRKVALERLSSPEQLDQLMQVTDPRGWLALGSLGALILAALVWGVLGSIPTEAQGEGILIRQGGVSNLVSIGEGQVEEILVEVGDEIHKGQAVATIRQDALHREIEETEARLAHLHDRYDELEGYAEEQRRLRGRNLEQQRANLERALATVQRQTQILQERLENDQQLFADGLITRQEVLATEQELNVAHDSLDDYRLQLEHLKLDRLEADQELLQQLENQRTEIRNLEFELHEQHARLEENRRVIATENGRVLELMAGRGDLVSPGTPVLSLEVESEELMAMLFIPASSGKQVAPGMAARISPSNVKREEYGFILGEVVRVSEFPATAPGMMRLLSNQALVTRLMEQGPPIQVNVALKRDPSTPSGFAWSSSTGPDLQISSGTLAQGSVIVREDRPIHLLIPRVRESLGV